MASYILDMNVSTPNIYHTSKMMPSSTEPISGCGVYPRMSDNNTMTIQLLRQLASDVCEQNGTIRACLSNSADIYLHAMLCLINLLKSMSGNRSYITQPMPQLEQQILKGQEFWNVIGEQDSLDKNKARLPINFLGTHLSCSGCPQQDRRNWWMQDQWDYLKSSRPQLEQAYPSVCKNQRTQSVPNRFIPFKLHNCYISPANERKNLSVYSSPSPAVPFDTDDGVIVIIDPIRHPIAFSNSVQQSGHFQGL
ncbi:uncharacterized protein DEA37_0011385 [Paragonimus westermani]|uniref:Uncharacterized protein n=1 Tax=Paragonimus westermani TaxID=34504 RepID=A0A5J4NI63_9TREM|nr:uncharacterized protein DEA37_0011385 [Paragonimus westermani]